MPPQREGPERPTGEVASFLGECVTITQPLTGPLNRIIRTLILSIIHTLILRIVPITQPLMGLLRDTKHDKVTKSAHIAGVKRRAAALDGTQSWL